MGDEEILTELLRLGVSPSLVAQVSVRFADSAALQRMRELNRTRQREWYKRQSPNVSNVRSNVSKVPPNTPLNTSSRSEPKKVLRSMPPDFLADLGYAMKRGLTGEQAQLEAEKFRDYCASHNKKYADWNAAWRNWVNSPYQRNGKANGNGAGTGLMDAFDRLIQRTAGDTFGHSATLRDITPRSRQSG